MSLVLAADPGYTPRPSEPCAGKGCRNRPSHTVRARLGSRVPSTLRVCSEHYALLEEAGELESPMPKSPPLSICLVPRCDNPRAVRGLCADHAAQVKEWPPGTNRVSSAFAMDLAEARIIDPSAVPLGETAGQAEPAPVEPERAPVVPPVVVPTTAPAMPHLPSVRVGMDRAADAMARALRGEAWSPDDLSGELVEVLRDLDRAHDKAHLRGMKDGHLRAAQALQDLLAGQGCDLTPLLPELQAALARLSLHLHEEHAARAALIDALNLGPPSASHVPGDTPIEEVVSIIRARAVALHDERQQRVALAERVRELETQRPPEPAWTRYRLSLCGHVALGEVEARRIEGGGLELRDGTLIGPAAIFQAVPVVEPPPLPEPSVGMRVRLEGRVSRAVLGVGSVEGMGEVVVLSGGAFLHRKDWARPLVEVLVEPVGEDTSDPNSLPF